MAKKKQPKRMSRKVKKAVKGLKQGPKITGAPFAAKGPQARKKMREVAIVTRKEQPVGIALRGKTQAYRTKTGKVIFAQVVLMPRLQKEKETGGMVSSTWIAAIYWEGRKAIMILLNDYEYDIYIPWRLFEQWYYAHSKGTFFNYVIKDKYRVVRRA